MDSNWILIALAIVVVIFAGCIGYYLSHRLNEKSNSKEKLAQPASVPTAEVLEASAANSLHEVELGTDLLVVDQDGKALVKTSELSSWPNKATLIAEKNHVAVKRAQHIAADIFKGAVGLPGKTIELVFDPAIQQGLKEGVLEIVPAAGRGSRLMARHVDGKKFAGHGRILEGGRARQLATGAFHLLSIAVAQSHLEDINRSLDEIKNAVSDVNRYLKDKDKARLRGTMNYLEYLVSVMNDSGSPEKVSSEKRNQLEAIRRETMEWAEQLRYETVALKEKIDAQQDVDTWGGTEHTFNAMKSHAEAGKDLLEKRSLLLRIMALLDVGTVYLDPIGRDKISLAFTTASLESIKNVEEALLSLRDRSHELLSKATWNTDATLKERRGTILSQQKEMLEIAKENQGSYISTIDMLNQQIKQLNHGDQRIHMALKFDGHGEVNQVAIM